MRRRGGWLILIRELFRQNLFIESNEGRSEVFIVLLE